MRPACLLTYLLVLIGLSGSSALALDRATLKLMRRTPIIEKINIEGNEAIEADEIRSKLYSKERTFWHSISGERRSRLRRETIRRDTLEVKYIYLKKGYLGVRVYEEVSVNIKDQGDSSISVTLNIKITEGKSYTFGPATVAGNYDSLWQGQFERFLRELEPGEPIDPFLIHRATFQMETYLANRGYPRAKVTHFVDTANCRQLCPVEFSIDTDSLVRFGTIKVEGLKGFPDQVARRELKMKPGEIYSQRAIADSRLRLYESGYFTSYTLVEDAGSIDPYRPKYLLRVRERKPHFLTVSTGPVGQSDVDDLLWSATLGFGKRNFIKTRRFSFSADYFFSTGADARLRRNIYSLKYTDPWFIGIRMPTTFNLEVKPRVRSEHEQEYYKSSWAISVSTLRKFGRFIRTDLGLEYESVNISGIPEEDILLLKQDNREAERRKLYFSFRRDTRDHFFTPRRGSFSELSTEYIGGFLGGDDNFLAIEGSWARYQILWPGWVSATRFKGGWVNPFGASGEVPADDRLYLGGANSVRGFLEKSLGPTRDGVAIGARYTLLFNQEFRWKTIQIFQKLPLVGKYFKKLPLWQSLFVDLGNGFNSLEAINLDNFAYAYGTGLQLVSPVGPIRVDYARRIKTTRYEFDYRWHFTILYAF